jgi:ankyrin repeat protein
MNPLVRCLVISLFTSLCCIGCGPSAPSTNLHQAVQDGNLYLVRKHIAAKTDLNKPDAGGWTPLQVAAQKGNLPVVQALAEAGADVKRKGAGGKTPLEVAKEKGQTAVVQYFQQQTVKRPGGRGLIDGGLGVSEVLDNQ